MKIVVRKSIPSFILVWRKHITVLLHCVTVACYIRFMILVMPVSQSVSQPVSMPVSQSNVKTRHMEMVLLMAITISLGCTMV